MIRRLHKYRCSVRTIACVAALLLCVGVASASQHFHGKNCADDVCAVCLFIDAESAVGSDPAYAGRHFSGLPIGAATGSFVPASRPFEPRRTRAPPIS